MEIPDAFGPFFGGWSFYPRISPFRGYYPPINYGHVIYSNNPVVPIHPLPINTFNNPEIIFPTTSFTTVNNGAISIYAPPINTVYHPPIVTPHVPLVTFFGGFPFYPQIAHGYMITSSNWLGPAGLAPPGSAYFDASPRDDWSTFSSLFCLLDRIRHHEQTRLKKTI